MLITWPLSAHLNEWVLGYPTIDSLDTIMLRGLVSDLLFENPGDLPTTQGVYFPTGFPILHLVPNLLDHLIGGGFSRILGFPRGDNVFWIALIAANGLAAHRLGFQLAKNHSAAILVGVAYAVSENFLREINLHHAPQALSPWAPLYLAAILRASESGNRKDAFAAGFWMALSGITYWYTALFLAVGSIPLFLKRKKAWRQFALASGVATCAAAPFLLPYVLHLGDLPLASLSQIPDPSRASPALDALPSGQAFLTEHGNDLALPFRANPLDTSNRVSWVLLVAVVFSLRNGGQRVFLWMAGLGAILALGPTLRLGSDPVLLAGDPIWLPFAWLAKASPLFERMTWPERWGILIALGMAASAAKAPRPRLLACLLVMETLLLSGNAPLQHTKLDAHTGWERLRHTEGAVLELPLVRNHQQAPFIGLHARIHGKPMVNPILLPPESQAPREWKAWIEKHGIIEQMQAIAQGVSPSKHTKTRAMLIESGVGAVALDTGPGAGLSPARIDRWRRGLTALFGPSEDQGGVVIWWLKSAPTTKAPPLSFQGLTVKDGDQWRKAMRQQAKRRPPPNLDTLIEPLWGW